MAKSTYGRKSCKPHQHQHQHRRTPSPLLSPSSSSQSVGLGVDDLTTQFAHGLTLTNSNDHATNHAATAAAAGVTAAVHADSRVNALWLLQYQLRSSNNLGNDCDPPATGDGQPWDGAT